MDNSTRLRVLGNLKSYLEGDFRVEDLKCVLVSHNPDRAAYVLADVAVALRHTRPQARCQARGESRFRRVSILKYRGDVSERCLVRKANDSTACELRRGDEESSAIRLWRQSYRVCWSRLC